MRPIPLGAALALGTGGCLRGEITDRPAIEGQVVGAVGRVALCTASTAECVAQPAVALSTGGAFSIPPLTRTVTLFLGADPLIGYSLIWACAPGGESAGALIGGVVAPEAPVPLVLDPDVSVPIGSIAGDATRLPTLEEARQRVRAACEEGP